MSVLVIGAAGNVGRLVVRAVLDRGTPVTALVRDTERTVPKGSVLAAPGVTRIIGDLTRPASIRRAMARCESVFLATPHSPDQVELQNAAVDAAAETGARLVKLSSWGPSVHEGSTVPGARRHWLTQQYAHARGVPATFLCPNYFMHVLTSRYAGEVRRRGVLVSPAGWRGISMVDARDVAEVAARVLTEDGHVGATYTLSGPTAPTYSKIADLLSQLTGRTVRYHFMSDAEFERWMAAEGRQEWETAHAAGIFAFYRAGGGELITDDVRRITGHPPRSIEDFLAERYAEFTPAAAAA
jgi:uncharacterized protein YbjT (DUF2867 family)